MNEKEFNGLILAELVKIANEVFTNEIEIAPGTYTAAELAKLKDANGNEIGQRTASKMRFRLNLLNIRIGVTVHLWNKKANKA